MKVTKFALFFCCLPSVFNGSDFKDNNKAQRKPSENSLVQNKPPIPFETSFFIFSSTNR